MVDKRCAVRV